VRSSSVWGYSFAMNARASFEEQLSLLPNRLSSRVEKLAHVSKSSMTSHRVPPPRCDRLRFTLVEFPAFDICKAIFRRKAASFREGGGRNYRKPLRIFPPISLCFFFCLSHPRVRRRKKYQMGYEKLCMI